MKLIVCVLVSLIHNKLLSACPTIISREQWGSRNVTTTDQYIRPAPFVIIHHSASPSCSTQEECSALCRSFQNFHIDVRGWSDIGYNFLIGGDGQIYEGRGWSKTGAHAKNWNDRSVGICFIGTFIESIPPTVAIRAVHKLIHCGIAIGEISSCYRLAGHRQVNNSTECPGEALYQLIQTWPHWIENPYGYR